MNQAEILKKYNFGLIGEVEKSNYEELRIDSKLQFLKYGLQNTLNLLWSNFPKIVDNEKNEVVDFKKIDKLFAFQKLEKLLYEQGIGALKNDFNVGEVLDYTQIPSGEITSLRVKVNLKNSIDEMSVIENYFYDENSKLIFEYSVIKPAKLSEVEALKKLQSDYKFNPTQPSQIPYTLFFNNFLRTGDLNLVNGEYFELMNRDLSVLLLDSYLSAPWIFVADGKSTKSQIQKGLKNISERVINVNPQLSLFDSQPFHILQGNPQAQTLIQKIEKTISWVKKFAFMKSDSADMGTKNLHTAEVQEINSDFEDYVEAKANLRELQLLDFFNTFYSSKNVNEVVICGSTKWLTDEAPKYSVNQNGVLVNPQFNNSLSITKETKENDKEPNL